MPAAPIRRAPRARPVPSRRQSATQLRGKTHRRRGRRRGLYDVHADTTPC